MDSEYLTEKIPDDMSVIVVSDLHLGGSEGPETVKRFCNFLKRIHSGDAPVFSPGETEEGKKQDLNIPEKILPPAKIILLGDILDLWNPRMQDRNNAFIDSLIVFLKLRKIPCDVIYVTGNHDEDMGEIVATYAEGSSYKTNPAYHIYSLFKGKKGKTESLKIAWTRDHLLEISPRHYPATSTHGHVRGLNAGGIHYVFIHGQQFDSQQVTYSIGKAIGCRFDIIDTIEGILNCSIIKEVRKSINLQAGIGIFSVIGILSFLLPLMQLDLASFMARWAVGAIVSLGFLAIFLKGIQLFGFRNKDLPSSPFLFKICAGLAVVEIAALIGGIYLYSYGMFESLYPAGLVIFFYILFIFVIPLLYSYLQNWLYGTFFSAKDYDVKAVYENALKNEQYTYNAEVLIFGHTHVSGTYPDTDDDIKGLGKTGLGKPTLLMNTGAWVRNETGIDDCFAYIDTKGVGLMGWNDETGEIHCKKYFPKEILKKRSYIQYGESG